ncbi:MAG: thioredoxin [Chitinophagaceae bacterium]|nr:thioredoxin [Chitinophagaceae bacterium]
MRLLILSVLLFLLGCNSTAQKNTELSADDFEKGLQQSSVQLLDVRTAGEYRSGHIQSALQANWNDEKEFAERTAALDKQKPVYVYCLSGPRSSAAAKWLRANGFDQVIELKGGFSNWKRSGKAAEGVANIKQMTMTEYQQQIAGKEYVLVDFGAEWCPPCRKMEPIINQFLAENKEVFFLRIDGGIHTNLMKQLNAEALPTFILLKNGQETWRYQGVLTSAELNTIWATKK